MNWKALLAVVTLVVLIYSPTWLPAASRTLRTNEGRLAATQRGARDSDEDVRRSSINETGPTLIKR